MALPAPATANRSIQSNGFTLIELSVVLVIIGLIIGSILVGKELIAQAQIHGTISAMDRYKAAYNTFLGKYNCVPGDCANASAFGFTSPLTGSAGAANGDGDGYIYSYSDGYTLPSGEQASREETWGALTHLYEAKLIPDDLHQVMAANLNKSNIPIAGGFMFFTSLRPNSPPAGYVMPPQSTNYLYIGGYPVNGIDFAGSAPILTPTQSYAIDTKIDDGLPMSGAVRATWDNTGGSCGNGVSISGPCFNAPTLRSQQAWRNGETCLDDSATPFIYWVSNTYASANVEATYGYCSIHVQVD